MSKVLRATTIVPDSLYVQREADQQLKQVLADMGRPGYVLVARQMGKTNLLLHARRTQQQENDAFLYVDLSNPFDTPRECFRSIVDTAFQSHMHVFGAVLPEVEAIRRRELPAHREHEQELRLLLQAITGRLVIILDEVDSLTTRSYSDQLFSQIRSTYFSTINVPEFERLVHVLSGVAEPSELIRNPKLSPFNIGIKIYLEDFTHEQYREFVAKSGIDLSESTVESVYDWLSGHPRMTWDVCSELEDLLLSGRDLSAADVDATVGRLYLERFDRPPVDHIRSLAEASAEIRAALIEIGYRKGGEISDAMRTKLYLAGIAGAAPGPVTIKNRVIASALSEKWLEDVERRSVGVLSIAGQHLSNGRYSLAIDEYKRFLAQGEVRDEQRLIAIDGITEALFQLRQYRESLEWLQRGRYTSALSQALYLIQRNREGGALFALQQYADALSCFEEVSKLGEGAQALYATLNWAACVHELQPERKEEIIRAYRDVIARAGEDPKLTAGERRTIEVTGRFNYLSALAEFGDVVAARTELQAALAIASDEARAVLLAKAALLEEPGERRTQLIHDAVDLIVSAKPRVSSVAAAQLVMTRSLLRNLLLAAYENDEACFDRLFDFALSNESADDSTAADLVAAALSSKGTEGVRNLMSRMLKRADTSTDQRFVFTRVLAFHTRGLPEQRVRIVEYIDALEGLPKARALDRMDLAIIYAAVTSALAASDHHLLQRLFSVLQRFRAIATRDQRLMLDYWNMMALGARGDVAGAVTIARNVAEDLRSAPTGKPELLDRKSLDLIRDAAYDVLARNSPVTTFLRPEPKIGRNERVTVRYLDGTIVSGKYKKLEDDVKARRCTLLGRDLAIDAMRGSLLDDEGA